MPWFYYVGRLIVWVVLFLLTRWRVRGKENIPGQGPVLVVANHLNLADPPVIGVSLGRTMMFMAKKELFHFPVISYLIHGFGAFPVHRGQLDRRALRQAEQVLANGHALVMFPEGMRSRSGRLRAAFPGAVLIALRCNAVILPVGITGTEKIKGATWFLHRPEITVNIGRPFHLPPVSGKITKAELTRLTDYMMGHVAGQLPQQYRGNYEVQGD